MALSTITARVDEHDKAAFDNFCANVGLNTSTAIIMVRRYGKTLAIKLNAPRAPWVNAE